MRKVKVLKILVVIMMLLLAVSMVAIPQVHAYDWDVDSLDGKSDMGNIKSKSENIVGAIINVVRVVALGVAIIMLAFVAMKYMSSAPGDRAEIKKHAVIYVVGAIVLFGTSGILTILKDFAGAI